MIHDDLFAEFDHAAAEYGWTRLGQPESHTRRYGKAIADWQVTVRIYANAAGTAIMRVTREQVQPGARRLGDDLRGRVAAKRAIAINWLRKGMD